MGLRASNTATISFNETEVPAANLLGEENHGFKLAMMTLDRTRPGVASMATGIARAAFEFAADYSKERVQFGVPIAMHQAIQFMIADMATKIEAARLLVWKSAVLLDQGKRNTLVSSHAKRFAADSAMEVTTDAVQVYGGYGFIKDYPVEKLMRDAKIMQLYEGTSQIQRLVIARETLMPRRDRGAGRPSGSWRPRPDAAAVDDMSHDGTATDGPGAAARADPGAQPGLDRLPGRAAGRRRGPDRLLQRRRGGDRRAAPSRRSGRMTREEWNARYGPFDEHGAPLASDELPLTVAVREGRPAYARLRVRGERGLLEVEAGALPLLGPGGLPRGDGLLLGRRRGRRAGRADAGQALGRPRLGARAGTGDGAIRRQHLLRAGHRLGRVGVRPRRGHRDPGARGGDGGPLAGGCMSCSPTCTSTTSRA